MKALLAPCANCPFRKDCRKGWLGESRMKEIITDTILGDGHFICHKTSDRKKKDQDLCAGRLILEGKINPYGNRSTRIAAALGMFPGYEVLKNQDIIFDTADEAINHHKK